MKFLFVLFFFSFLAVSCSPTSDEPIACDNQNPCPEGYYCDNASQQCKENQITNQDTGNQNDNGLNDNGNNDQGGNNDGSQEDKAPDLDSTMITTCTPGETTECYTGPSGTKGVGICKSGVSTCNYDGTAWSNCDGAVLPQVEICGDGIDQNCDGQDATPENTTDIDGDGFTYCNGDCCETAGECPDPAKVNPAAYEIAGNTIDDNCNGQVDEEEGKCDSGLNTASTDPIDMAKAIDMCPAVGEKGYGLIKAELLFPNGNALSDPYTLQDGTSCPAIAVPKDAYAIFNGYGSVIKPHRGDNFFAMSSGQTKNPHSTDTNFDNKTQTNAPDDWYQANGSKFPSSPACGANDTPGENPTNDPVMLKVKLRAPINAESFSFDIYFLSQEFPEYVCSFNDSFIALLDSKFTDPDPNLQNPKDKNLAMDANKNPVGINLAMSGLFTVCNKSALKPAITKYCVGNAEIKGTGFEAQGATGWLTTKGNIVPGEEFELRLAIWDTGDHVLDSLILIDNFKWNPTKKKPGTGIQD